MKEHYKTLGVDPKATQEEIKKAYRNKSRSLHPDKGGDDKSFGILSTAYALLNDPARRKFYDKTGINTDIPDIEKKAGKAIQDIFKLAEKSLGLEKIIHIDLIDSINKHIDKGMVELNKKRKETAKRQADLAIIQNKLKSTGKRDPLGFYITQEMILLGEQITQLNLESETGKIAKEMLKDYTFDFDKQEIDPNRFLRANVVTYTASGGVARGPF